MSASDVIFLQAGPYEAVVETSGATLASLTRDGRDLIAPYDPLFTLPSGWQGKTLIPWPNRVAGARYRYAGEEFQLACNEPETGSALHGLVGWLPFTVVDDAELPLGPDGLEDEECAGATQEPFAELEGSEAADAGIADDALAAVDAEADSDSDAVELELLLPASPAYPWSLLIGVRYELHSERGLSVSITTTNLGAAMPPHEGQAGAPLLDGHPAPAPYGVGVHPYLTRSCALDECTLVLPASRALLTDERTKAPTQDVPITETPWNWLDPTTMGEASVDHAFTELITDAAGQWQVRLADPDGSAVVLASNAPWVQLYSGEHMDRQALAVEPMTCPPNAFNSGRDLITLASGESHTLRYRIHED